ncbi:MAG: anti-sigma factor domain-containing protein [Gemmatimonadaceae bacterium]
MIRPTSHEEAQALLAIEALDALKGEERDALLAHAGGCAECSAQLAELRDTAAILVELLPTVPLDSGRSAAIRSRLLARAAADVAARRGEAGFNAPDEPRANAPPSPVKRLDIEPLRAIGRSTGSRFGWYAAAAAVMLAAGLLSVVRSARRDADGLRSELAAVRAERFEAEAKLVLRDSLLEQLTGSSVHIVGLTANGPEAPVGWVFWDQSEKWTLVAHNLPNVAPNRTYQLWLITPGQRKLSMGTFTSDQRGHAVFRATFPLPRDSVAAVAVTLEPAGGVPQPTGPITLSGAATALGESTSK